MCVHPIIILIVDEQAPPQELQKSLPSVLIFSDMADIWSYPLDTQLEDSHYKASFAFLRTIQDARNVRDHSIGNLDNRDRLDCPMLAHRAQPCFRGKPMVQRQCS